MIGYFVSLNTSPINQDIVNGPLDKTQKQLDIFPNTRYQLGTPNAFTFNMPPIKTDVPTTIKSSSSVSEVKTFVDEGKQFTNGRKYMLKPYIRYKTGEYDYFYETDNLSRVSKFETENLQLTKREERLSHSRNTPGKVKGQDHAGHFAGDRFGGSPKIDNLVSQLSDVNLKQYKKIEDEWATALKETPPQKVTVNVEIKYDVDNTRPSEFIVQYEIDGKYEVVNILN